MKTYFISGVNGVGKSTLIPHLRELLSADRYEVIDFDSRGVPDGADRAWRIRETEHWLSEGLRLNNKGKELIVCGFAKPSDFEGSSAEFEIVVLDADKDTILKRLIERYTKDGIFDAEQKVIGKPVMEFIDGNVWYAQKMREESLADGLAVIDTSNKTPEEVANEVLRLLLKS